MEKLTLTTTTLYFILENSVHTAYVGVAGLGDNTDLVEISRKLNLLESCVRSARMHEKELTPYYFGRLSTYVAHLENMLRSAKVEGVTAICLTYSAITCLNDLRYTLNSIAITNDLPTVY